MDIMYMNMYLVFKRGMHMPLSSFNQYAKVDEVISMYYNNVNVKDHTNTVKRERIQSQDVQFVDM